MKIDYDIADWLCVSPYFDWDGWKAMFIRPVVEYNAAGANRLWSTRMDEWYVSLRCDWY